MGSSHHRSRKLDQKQKKIYIPKTYRQSDIQESVWAVYRWVYPYIWGTLCFSLAFMLIWGLWNYRSDMPSWGTLTTLYPDVSWFDYVTNYQADIMLQFVGVLTILYSVLLMAWGAFFIFRRRITYIKSRGVLAIFATIVLAIVVAAMGATLEKAFPLFHESLPSGFGGALGNVFLKYASAFFNMLSTPIYTLFLIALTLLGISMFILSLGLSNQQIKQGIRALGRGIAIVGRYAYVALKFGVYVFGIAIHRIKSKIFKGNDLGTDDYPLSYHRGQHRHEPMINTPEFAASGDIYDTYDEDDPEDDWNNHGEVLPEPEPKKSLVESFKEKTFKKTVQRISKSKETYNAPSLELLTPPAPSIKDPSLSRKVLEENAERLMQVLNEFGVKGRILGVKPGPVVTLYELEPAAGVKSSRIISLADDIARSMSARSARVSVIPGRNAMGIELPNEHRETVSFREILSSHDFRDNGCQLPLGLGKDIGGHPIITDLAKMPHLLVAGTTGSGKSVGVNAMILSLLFKLSPDECKFIMIDPKMLELSIYDGIPHLLSPVVTEPKKAIVALKWVVQEMEARYRAMAQLSVRNIQGYNEKLKRSKEAGEVLTRRVQTGFDPASGSPVFEDQELDMTLFPYIVVVVDEMADLMLVAGKEIEAAVQRLAQMARAAGIHLIMATQRPSVDVITGTIKANFPTRIGFQVTSKIDSRTILGEQGAEQLLGRGDMLYMEPGGRIRRVHGAFVADDEVERVVSQLKAQQDPAYVDIYSVADEFGSAYGSDMMDAGEGSGDDLYDKALSIVLSEGKVSTSFIQRHLSIGYNRAAKIVEQMEKEGVISAPNHSGKREILVPHEKR